MRKLLTIVPTFEIVGWAHGVVMQGNVNYESGHIVPEGLSIQGELGHIGREIYDLIKRVNPTEIVVLKPSDGRNYESAVWGVINLICNMAGEYTENMESHYLAENKDTIKSLFPWGTYKGWKRNRIRIGEQDAIRLWALAIHEKTFIHPLNRDTRRKRYDCTPGDILNEDFSECLEFA